ncbi:MAG: HPr-rel-A system PqqD family peptide chaperone [Comamonadaceae bacterium]|nr:HPr-rel-A system PqqD family peptide chaperone [Comamonadaceae bacterium]
MNNGSDFARTLLVAQLNEKLLGRPQRRPVELPAARNPDDDGPRRRRPGEDRRRLGLERPGNRRVPAEERHRPRADPPSARCLPAATRWTLARDPSVRVRTWRDETTALGYDERSGDTFVLDALALETLSLLEEAGPLTLPELRERICGELDAEPPPTLDGDIAAELRRLASRGLVAPLT